MIYTANKLPAWRRLCPAHEADARGAAFADALGACDMHLEPFQIVVDRLRGAVRHPGAAVKVLAPDVSFLVPKFDVALFVGSGEQPHDDVPRLCGAGRHGKRLARAALIAPESDRLRFGIHIEDDRLRPVTKNEGLRGGPFSRLVWRGRRCRALGRRGVRFGRFADWRQTATQSSTVFYDHLRLERHESVKREVECRLGIFLAHSAEIVHVADIPCTVSVEKVDGSGKSPVRIRVSDFLRDGRRCHAVFIEGVHELVALFCFVAGAELFDVVESFFFAVALVKCRSEFKIVDFKRQCECGDGYFRIVGIEKVEAEYSVAKARFRLPQLLGKMFPLCVAVFAGKTRGEEGRSHVDVPLDGIVIGDVGHLLGAFRVWPHHVVVENVFVTHKSSFVWLYYTILVARNANIGLRKSKVSGCASQSLRVAQVEGVGLRKHQIFL